MGFRNFIFTQLTHSHALALYYNYV